MKRPDPKAAAVSLARGVGASLAKRESPGQLGINVRSDTKAGVRYADEIVDGNKKYETRDSDSLRPYVNRRMAIVRTGEGPAVAIGEATIGEPIVADRRLFHQLRDQHLVPEGSTFDIKPGSKKYLYPIIDPRRFDAEKSVGTGIVARKVIEKAAGGVAAPAAPDHLSMLAKAADQQRGNPEIAMTQAQRAIGGGVLSFCLEHVGDIYNRMHNTGYGKLDEYGATEERRNVVLDKIAKTLRTLNQKYGFEREHEENLKSNEQNKVENGEQSPESYRAGVDAALKKYAQEHSKLPVYNRPQELARAASIALGKSDFGKAASSLFELKRMAEDHDLWHQEVNKVNGISSPVKTPRQEQPEEGEDGNMGSRSLYFAPELEDYISNTRKAAGGPVEDTLLDSTGKPVHHTPEGVENFKRWHEGSHVVDKQGRPLVVYHGTGGDFSKFQADLTGSRHRDLEVGGAFYFSDDKETANWYAESAGRQAKGGANVMPVYLRMTNPLVVEYGGADSQYLYEDIQKAKDLGHDGVLARNIDDGGVSTHFIAFDRSQIKSAIGNDGTWDHPSDITKARGGQVETVEGPEREQNLKNWLGDSLLHDNGVPRTYYHGTSKDKPFTSFNVGRHGAWFTSDPEDASSYAHQNDSMTSVYESGRFVDRNTASRVMPVYLKASNPFLGERPEKYRNAENYKKAQSDWFDELRAAGYDSWIPQSAQGRLAVMLGGSHQIKSAIGNDGTFDHPSNISKAEGGQIDQPDRPLAPAATAPQRERYLEGSQVENQRFVEGHDPRLVFHATASTPFNEFNPERSDLGIHVGSLVHAQDRLRSKGNVSDDGVLEQARVIPLYAKAKNLLRMEDHGNFQPANVISQLEDQGILSEKDSTQMLKRMREQSGPAYPYGIKSSVGERVLREHLKGLGYDGVVYLNRGEGMGRGEPDYSGHVPRDMMSGDYNDQDVLRYYPDAHDSYILFDAGQVKSPHASDYDESEKDYLKASGGEVEGDDEWTEVYPLDPKHAEKFRRDEKAEGGQVEGALLNSAGKPVHHTPEGVEAFKQWFGDSKSVDEQSRPVVMYRGVAGNATQGINAGALNAEPRVKDWATFATTSPSMAATYAAPDFKWDEAGALVPVYVKADKLIEFPVRKTDYGNRHDKVKFDMEAARLSPGEVLVARNVIDTGPRSNEAYSVDKEMQYSYPADIYAWGPGTSVKSAVGNDGTWDHPTDITKAEGGEVDGQPPAQPAQPAPPARKFNSIGLYSHAAEQALKLPQTRGSLDQMLGALKNKGVKQDEIDFAGFGPQFAGSPSVTKQELADHFNANMPEFFPQTDTAKFKDYSLQKDEENRRAGGELAGKNYREHLLRLSNPSSGQPFTAGHWPDVENITAHLRTQDFKDATRAPRIAWEHPDLNTTAQIATNESFGPGTKREYPAMQTSIPGLVVNRTLRLGAKNHEYNLTHADSGLALLNTVPYHAIRQFVDEIKPLGINWELSKEELSPIVPNEVKRKTIGMSDKWEEYYGKPVQTPVKRKAKSSDRDSALLIDELQSDWGQKSRSLGVAGSPEMDAAKETTKRLESVQSDANQELAAVRSKMWPMRQAGNIGQIDNPAYSKARLEERQLLETLGAVGYLLLDQRKASRGVVKGPYVDNTEKWTDLGLKYALKKAVDEKHSHLVFTPSSTQIARYRSAVPSLIDSISVRQEPVTGAYQVRAFKGNSEVYIDGLNGTYGSTKKLASIFPKEIIDMITSNNPDNYIPDNNKGHPELDRITDNYQYSLPNEIEIGKSGQQFMYDKLIPKRLLALARQHDPDAKLTTYQGKHEAIKGFPALEITPAMAKSIKENGFKAFKRGGAVGDVDHALRVARKARGMT